MLSLCRRLKMAMEIGRAVKTTTRMKAIDKATVDISESTIVNPESEGTDPPARKEQLDLKTVHKDTQKPLITTTYINFILILGNMPIPYTVCIIIWKFNSRFNSLTSHATGRHLHLSAESCPAVSLSLSLSLHVLAFHSFYAVLIVKLAYLSTENQRCS